MPKHGGIMSNAESKIMGCDHIICKVIDNYNSKALDH